MRLILADFRTHGFRGICVRVRESPGETGLRVSLLFPGAVSSLALKCVLGEAFEGILVTDFWVAYDALFGGLHLCCLFNLHNELVKVDLRNLAAEWQTFARQV